MNWNRYLRTDQKEIRLIDLVTWLYFFNVFLYTIDDFKRDFPAYLRLLGLLMHVLVAFVLIQGIRKPNIPLDYREIIKKLLPFGLLLTYSLSYYTGLNKGFNMSALPIFAITAVPMILYLFSLAFDLRILGFLKDRRRVYNFGFMGLFVIVYLWIKFSK